jgi:hypothetical protein
VVTLSTGKLADLIELAVTAMQVSNTNDQCARSTLEMQARITAISRRGLSARRGQLSINRSIEFVHAFQCMYNVRGDSTER